MNGIICPNPNCSYKGLPERRAKGSRLALWILVIVCFPIGLVYAILKSGHVYSCPRCHNEVHAG